jgi:hypothetical protein
MTKIIDDDDDIFDSRGVLKDGATLTTKMFMKDGSINPKLSPAQRVAAAVAATKAAMTGFDSSLHDSAMHRPGFRRAATGTADAIAATTARDSAYSDYERDQANAWRGTDSKMGDRKVPPAGSYPTATGCNVGDICTVNGAPGTLQQIDGYDGYLECIATDGNDNDTGDSRTVHDTGTPQQIKEAMYSSYDSEIQDAWRNK